MATQPPQSLPSFAQAFGAPSLSRIPDASNDLPPIHPRASPLDHPGRSPSTHDDQQPHQLLPAMRDTPRQSSRKRAHPDASAHLDEGLSSGSESVSPPSSNLPLIASPRPLQRPSLAQERQGQGGVRA
ncbi:hypothetical protein BD414DRAFT_119467 [Trametes punicea]|nr:hypothetical protein BD414DRAFT_119467 [Trametes punicea]